MEITEMTDKDAIHLKNLIIAHQTKIEFNKLGGNEVRALSEAITWLEKVYEDVVKKNPGLINNPTAPNAAPVAPTETQPVGNA